MNSIHPTKEEKLYREAYEEITWFLHSSPKVKSIAIDRYVDLHSMYQRQPDKHQEAAKCALIVYRLTDFSDDFKWKVSFKSIEEQHVFLRLLHLDDTNEGYKRLASEKDKAKNEGSSSRSRATPLSEKNATPAGRNKKQLDVNAALQSDFDLMADRIEKKVNG
ncbi:hypothetical protein ASPTUDRAFT_136317 [Aspergillus tubingensis CBS 134.48]|uniref:Uncharacterized protein n=1 Tax=Aspergillus tubingensis (strain CBS 134.48) TaxID=767770 RepID=A0A1L9NG24_ASPTC|nr:hypothetical protein ASPTUDRAFT_136317 [Aspergillus tubingensis CBS 134.48]